MNELMETVFEKNMGLYIVHDAPIQLREAFSTHRHYSLMLRWSEQDHLHVHALLNDFWHFFYYEPSTLLLEPNNSLYYTVRATILQLFTTQDHISKLRTWTAGKIEEALLAAVEITNLCIDVYKQLIHDDLISSAHYSLATQFRSIDTKVLFSERFKIYIEHPRQFTEMQAYVVKLLNQLSTTHHAEFQQLIHHAAQRIQNIQYVKAKISQ